MSGGKRVALWALAISMVTVGVLHFVRPEPFLDIMPPWLPWHLALVYVSGFFEVLGGLGLLVPATRKAAAWGLIALFVCVFPANVHQAINQVPIGGSVPPVWALWLRLPLQLVLIYWAWVFTRPPAEASSAP